MLYMIFKTVSLVLQEKKTSRVKTKRLGWQTYVRLIYFKD